MVQKRKGRPRVAQPLALSGISQATIDHSTKKRDRGLLIQARVLGFQTDVHDEAL